MTSLHVTTLSRQRRKYSNSDLTFAIIESFQVNVVGQILFTDCFLGWEFSTYGASVLSLLELDDEERIDPMSKVFPRVRNFLDTHFIQILA